MRLRHVLLSQTVFEIKKDHIYIARPNQHLLVKDNKFIPGAGPEQNRFRPSIDVLFRSAAVAYSPHAIGIILSSLLEEMGLFIAEIVKHNEGGKKPVPKDVIIESLKS
jgi:hypothetical protein